jgi:hypothetical protein
MDTWASVSARLALRPDLELVRRVPGLQGTDSGPRAHLRRSSEPVGGANILFPRRFSEFCTLVFRSGRTVLPMDAWWPTIWEGHSGARSA